MKPFLTRIIHAALAFGFAQLALHLCGGWISNLYGAGYGLWAALGAFLLGIPVWAIAVLLVTNLAQRLDQLLGMPKSDSSAAILGFAGVILWIGVPIGGYMRHEYDFAQARPVVVSSLEALSRDENAVFVRLESPRIDPSRLMIYVDYRNYYRVNRQPRQYRANALIPIIESTVSEFDTNKVFFWASYLYLKKDTPFREIFTQKAQENQSFFVRDWDATGGFAEALAEYPQYRKKSVFFLRPIASPQAYLDEQWGYYLRFRWWFNLCLYGIAGIYLLSGLNPTKKTNSNP